MSIERLIANNRVWSKAKTEADPDFFARLALQQAPEYLWIGCSDSRVPANEIVGLDPGELFVHRNVGNLASPQDANYLAVLQYSVQVLKVRHVLVVGHYDCGGVLAALRRPGHGVVDHWITPIRELAIHHRAELEALEPERRRNRLAELNVARQVQHVAANPLVLQAWARGQGLRVHGLCYATENGELRDLGGSVGSPQEVKERFGSDVGAIDAS